ncbi:MAG: hypothetical protein FWH24_02240 [Oscillospiraceae bacterium]|nr:hypothetical protein [Oscillospiraceae bacterium]
MINKERFKNTFLCRETDRAPFNFYFGPWGETLERWQKEGLSGKNWAEPFGFDPGVKAVPLNYGPFPGFEHTVLEKKEYTQIMVNHFGAVQEISLTGPTIPKYLKFPVTGIDEWRKYKRERLDPGSAGRFPHNFKAAAEELNNYDGMVQLGGYPYGLFGTVRELMGLENLMYAFYDNPELVHMIMDDLTDFWLSLYEKACRGIKVDIIHIWEDMSGKQGSLISPALMYEFMVPNYKKIRKFAESHGIHTLMLDTDGNVADIVQVFIDGGINCLLPFEVTAGCDVLEYRRKYPELCIMGGVDKLELAKGREAIDAELARIAPMFGYPGYIAMPDHLPHPDISWEDFLYFGSKLKELIFSFMR